MNSYIQKIGRLKNPLTTGKLEQIVYDINESGKDELKVVLKEAVARSKDHRVSGAKRIIYRDVAKLIRKELKKYDPSRNPKRRKKNADTEAYELGLYADNLGPSSKGLENDVYEIRQKFLVAIKKGRPKKELVNLTKHAAHRAARAYSKAFGSGAYAWQEIFSDSDLNKAAKYLYDSWEEESDVKLNPKRRKTMRKKKRSAKQLANDKRLGRMAKARAAKKRGKNPCNYGRKKTVRKKNTHRRVVRKRNASASATGSHKMRRTSKGRWYQIFKCKGANVHFLALTTDGKIRWTLTRGDTVRWSSKSEATKIAKRISKSRKLSGYSVGVASSTISMTAIIAWCKKEGK